MTISSRPASSGMLNLDTHILIKALEGALTAHERTVLSRDADWSISAIVLWEIEKLHERERLQYGLDYPPLATALDRLEIWPIDRAVCLSLRSLDFESDPADELIAATSLTHRIPLVTRDRRIRKSKLIRCL
ncbi:MAG TPA: PIN domain-containing protein [Bryobacteraceae bacterium]|nr:PIN domain-containing protein [Bryobacteraceae bacterium]